MPTISSFYGILIRMFYSDHPPPHFHARYGEFEATVNIGTLEVMEGQLPRRALNLVREWAMMHKKNFWTTGASAGRTRLRRRLSHWHDRSQYSMHWDVVEVKPEPRYRLFVRFKDGVAGHVQLRPEDLTGALAPLRDERFFGQVFIDYGAVAWPGEIDLAPDAMYAQIAGQRDGLRQVG